MIKYGKITVKELKQFLKSNNIKFLSKSNKPELYSLYRNFHKNNNLNDNLNVQESGQDTLEIASTNTKRKVRKKKDKNSCRKPVPQNIIGHQEMDNYCEENYGQGNVAYIHQNGGQKSVCCKKPRTAENDRQRKQRHLRITMEYLIHKLTPKQKQNVVKIRRLAEQFHEYIEDQQLSTPTEIIEDARSNPETLTLVAGFMKCISVITKMARQIVRSASSAFHNHYGLIWFIIFSIVCHFSIFPFLNEFILRLMDFSQEIRQNQVEFNTSLDSSRELIVASATKFIQIMNHNAIYKFIDKFYTIFSPQLLANAQNMLNDYLPSWALIGSTGQNLLGN